MNGSDRRRGFGDLFFDQVSRTILKWLKNIVIINKCGFKDLFLLRKVLVLLLTWKGKLLFSLKSLNFFMVFIILHAKW